MSVIWRPNVVRVGWEGCHEVREGSRCDEDREQRELAVLVNDH